MKGKVLAVALFIITASFFTESLVIDTSPPEIKNVKAIPNETWQGEEVEISCDVTDADGVASVRVIIKYPDGSVANMTMKKGSCLRYYYRDAYDVVGIYTYYIWANDTLGNQNKSANHTFIIKKDTLPPITYCTISGDIGENGWYVSNVTIKLESNDVGTGVNTTYYRLDLQPWLEYKYPFIVKNEGLHKIYYYAEDFAGNKEKTKYREFKIDKTSPVTECNLSGKIGCNDWYVGNVTVTLSAEDGVSGVDKIFYKIDDRKWNEYEEPFTVSEDGFHEISFYSIDKAGNEEEVKVESFKIDKVHPQVKFIKPREGYLYLEDREIIPTITGRTVIIGRITIQVNATNHESGINRVEFYIDNDFQTQDKEKPYEWTWDYLSFGTHSIKAIAYDNAGNSGSDEIIIWIINI